MDNIDPASGPSNVPEFTVSELSFALKREIETAFPRVRVRGEIRGGEGGVERGSEGGGRVEEGALAREGREGRRIGTIFTLGDEEAVLARSRPLILDPMSGHPASSRHITDLNLRGTIKELAQLDGAFVGQS